MTILARLRGSAAPLRRVVAKAGWSRTTDAEHGIARMECWALQSAVLPEPAERTVSVYLPECYGQDPDRRFPVFYLHDGQNLFDPATCYVPGRTWRAGETADWLTGQGKVQPVILVGVANTGLRRLAEYTPTRDSKMGGGEGRSYGRLLVEELKPLIDGAYRTLDGAANTGLGGSSLGGLISLFLGLEYADVFGRLAVISPSLWWDHRAILQYVKDASLAEGLRVWVDIGTAEGLRHVRDTEMLGRLLGSKGLTDLRVDVVPEAVHDENAWAARFGNVLEFLFPEQAK